MNHINLWQCHNVKMEVLTEKDKLTMRVCRCLSVGPGRCRCGQVQVCPGLFRGLLRLWGKMGALAPWLEDRPRGRLTLSLTPGTDSLPDSPTEHQRSGLVTQCLTWPALQLSLSLWIKKLVFICIIKSLMILVSRVSKKLDHDQGSTDKKKTNNLMQFSHVVSEIAPWGHHKGIHNCVGPLCLAPLTGLFLLPLKKG